MFLKKVTTKSTESYWDNIEQLKSKLKTTDAVVIGAGAGLSTAAGFTYSGERFQKYFSDFIEKYNFKDMYSGGFYLDCQLQIGQKLFSRVRRSKLNWRKITKRAVNTIIIEPMNVISEF